MYDDTTQKGIAFASELITRSGNTVALTGAGISVESGIPPFRGEGGLWERYDPEEYAHIESFKRDPKKVWVMLKELMETCLGAEPNRAHLALAKLEKRGLMDGIITQNIDGLHQRAGSGNVVEFHGGNNSMSCLSCGRGYRTKDVSLDIIPPRCDCGGLLRPDFVFFGEQIPALNLSGAVELARNCELMLIIGTTGMVMPAAQMPYLAKSSGASLVDVNPDPSAYGRMVDIHLEGRAGDMMECIMNRLHR